VGILEKNIMMLWLKKQGVVFCYEEPLQRKMNDCVSQVSKVFKDLVELVAVFYVYDLEKQKRKGNEYFDAEFWFNTLQNGKMLFAIGLSTKALNEGAEYSTLCLLHELTHLQMPEENNHNMKFHSLLNRMIRHFNDATGQNIKNDYDQLNFRYDSRTYEIDLEKVPHEEVKKGSQFRTEALR